MTADDVQVGNLVTPIEQAEMPNRALYRVLHVATYLDARHNHMAVYVFQAVRPATNRVYVRERDDFCASYAITTEPAP